MEQQEVRVHAKEERKKNAYYNLKAKGCFIELIINLDIAVIGERA